MTVQPDLLCGCYFPFSFKPLKGHFTRLAILCRDALDREKGTQIEELSRKLGQAHLTSEQYRNQAESTSKQLDQAEQAKFDIETELAKLKLEVLAQSDSRYSQSGCMQNVHNPFVLRDRDCL